MGWAGFAEKIQGHCYLWEEHVSQKCQAAWRERESGGHCDWSRKMGEEVKEVMGGYIPSGLVVAVKIRFPL